MQIEELKQEIIEYMERNFSGFLPNTNYNDIDFSTTQKSELLDFVGTEIGLDISTISPIIQSSFLHSYFNEKFSLHNFASTLFIIFFTEELNNKRNQDD